MVCAVYREGGGFVSPTFCRSILTLVNTLEPAFCEGRLHWVLLLPQRKAPMAMSLKSFLVPILLPCSLVPCSVKVSIQHLHPSVCVGGGGGRRSNDSGMCG